MPAVLVPGAVGGDVAAHDLDPQVFDVFVEDAVGGADFGGGVEAEAQQ
ncbi:MAG: hypothetical protein P8171_19920 [Candidatus Thiodiazotropha sp.]